MKKGMTLPEIIVVCALLGIISACLYNILFPGIRTWKKSDIKSDLQRNGLIALKMISDELRTSDIESVKIFSKSYEDRKSKKVFHADAISFLSPFGKTDEIKYNTETGNILWQKHGIFYIDPLSHNLYLQENYIDPPTNSPEEYQISSFSPNHHRDRVIARNIYILTFWADQDPQKDGKSLKNPITFEIGIKIENFDTILQSGVSTLHNQE